MTQHTSHEYGLPYLKASGASRLMRRMSFYEIVLFLHIASATIWLGAGFTLFLLVFKAERSPDRADEPYLADANNWLAPRLFIPASLATLIFGILLVVDGPWGFGDLWILVGLAGYAASFLVGILFMKPEGERIEHAMREHGPKSPQARRHVRRIVIVSRAELAVLFIVVADMALKPTSDDVGTLAAFAAAAALAVVAAVATAPKADSVATPTALARD
jgi:uncharacterized membrane protein